MQLHTYQQKEADFIVSTPQCAIFAEMGTGKTAATIEAVKRLALRRVLVVSHPRIARHVWPEESVKWNCHLSCHVVSGTPAQRKRIWEREGDGIWTVSYGSMHEAVKMKWDMIIFDESTLFKSYKTRRTKYARQLAQTGKPDRPRLVLLTGTPNPNSLADLWMQIWLIDGGKRLFPTRQRFMETYFVSAGFLAPGIPRYREKPQAEETVSRAIADVAMSIQAKDVLDLPAMVQNTVRVDLPEKAMKEYRMFEAVQLLSLCTQLEENQEKATTSGSQLAMSLMQMASGFIYLEDGKIHPFHEAKIEALRELRDQISDNILLSYWFRADRERIMAAFPEAEDLSEGKDTMERWNRKEIRMGLLQPQKGGHGLNLQHGGHTVVWFGPVFALELKLQLDARLHRQGQPERVMVHTLIASGTIDEAIMALSKKKRTKLELIMDLVNFMKR